MTMRAVDTPTATRCAAAQPMSPSRSGSGALHPGAAAGHPRQDVSPCQLAPAVSDGRRALFLAVARCRCGDQFIPAIAGHLSCQQCTPLRDRPDFETRARAMLAAGATYAALAHAFRVSTGQACKAAHALGLRASRKGGGAHPPEVQRAFQAAGVAKRKLPIPGGKRHRVYAKMRAAGLSRGAALAEALRSEGAA